MARIKIECSEGDKLHIQEVWLKYCDCPFDVVTKECKLIGGCKECLDKNVEFVIKEESND